mmetsp:Transcript_114841/g.288664  ORF Transcript_114841/g.288664 Transcript_114841/m.288664 type:complete len:262 (+) Transcript_114841:25-810(+)
MYKAPLDGIKYEPASPEKEWRRNAVTWVMFTLLCLGVFYEYSQRNPPRRNKMPPPIEASPAQVQESQHLIFMKELQKAKEAPEPEVSLTEAKEMFREKYSDSAKPLLCSGCKMTAARIGEELSARNATGQPDPTALLNVMHEAVDASCEKLPAPLVISRGHRGAFFGTYQAPDGHQLSGLEQRKAEVARKNAQQLCMAILGETKLDFLEALIRRKVPHARHMGPGQPESDNWERWLCARHTRLCKRSEVQEDDEEDEEGEL